LTIFLAFWHPFFTVIIFWVFSNIYFLFFCIFFFFFVRGPKNGLQHHLQPNGLGIQDATCWACHNEITQDTT
jgi:hypothetical protein